MPNWLHKCSYTCWLTHARWKWFLHQQPALLLALEGYLIPLLSWKREDRARGWGGLGGREKKRKKRKKLDWAEKNNRELRKLSGQGRVSVPSDSRSESSSSWNSCSWGRQSRAPQSSSVMSGSTFKLQRLHIYASARHRQRRDSNHVLKQQWEVTNYTHSSSMTINESFQLLYTYSAAQILLSD